MKKLILSLVLVMACASMACAGIMDLNVRGNENSTWVECPVQIQRVGMVRGHFRSNGTYVQPYYRTEPDGYKWNNKSNW